MRCFAIVILLAGCASTAMADFVMDFESYTTGDLVPQDGWALIANTSPTVTDADYVIDGTKSGLWTVEGSYAWKNVSQGALAVGNVLTIDQMGQNDEFCMALLNPLGNVFLSQWFTKGGASAFHNNEVYRTTWTFTSTGADSSSVNLTAAQTPITATLAYVAGETVDFVGLAFRSYGDGQTVGGVPVPVYGSLDNISYSSVPEPSTVVLLMTGLVGLLAYAWRKRK